MHKILILLLSLLIPGTIRCQDYFAFKTLFTHTDKIDIIATSDNYYATGSDDRSVIVRDYRGKKIFNYKIDEGRIDALAFINNTNSLLIALAEFNSDGFRRYTIKKIDIATNQSITFLDTRLTQEYVDLFYQENTQGSRNAVQEASQRFPQLNVKANSGIPQVKDGQSHIESIQYLSISPDQNTIASIDRFNILKLWNKSGEILKSFRITNGKKDTHIYFITDSTLMITPNIIFDTISEKLSEIVGFNSYFGIPIKGKIYFCFDYFESSKAEKLYDMKTDSSIDLNTKNTYPLKASVSDNKFALLGVDGLIRVRDLNGNLVSTFGSDKPFTSTVGGKKIFVQSRITQVGISPNGEYIISGDKNGKEIVWKSK